jgi:hypothetical protein
MPDSRGPLPIIGVSAVTLGEPSPGKVPVIAVDASGHPDMARLRREIERTKNLVTHTLWFPTLQRPKATLLLSVTVRAPIVCGFRLRFELPESRELLLSLSRAGRVILTLAPLGAGGAFDNSTAIPLFIPDPHDIVKTTIAEVDSWAERADQPSDNLA